MQGGFIGGLKENLKALKQELKGADIYDSPVKFSKSAIYNKDFRIGISIYRKDFFFKTIVYEKKRIQHGKDPNRGRWLDIDA